MTSPKITLIVFGVLAFIGLGLSTLAYYFWQSDHRLKTEGIAMQNTVFGY